MSRKNNAPKITAKTDTKAPGEKPAPTETPAETATEVQPAPTPEADPATPAAEATITPPAEEVASTDAPTGDEPPTEGLATTVTDASAPPAPTDEPEPPVDAVDATVEAPIVEAMPAGDPPVQVILGDITGLEDPVGYLQRTPTPELSYEESQTQAKLFHALAARGLSLRDQGGVYPWLLRQIAKTVSE